MTKTKPWNIKEGVYEVHLSKARQQTLAELRKKGLETPREGKTRDGKP